MKKLRFRTNRVRDFETEIGFERVMLGAQRFDLFNHEIASKESSTGRVFPKDFSVRG
jgi:hypothetical protein